MFAYWNPVQPILYSEGDSDEDESDSDVSIGEILENIVTPIIEGVVDALTIAGTGGVGAGVVIEKNAAKAAAKEAVKRVFNITKQESAIWQNLDNYRGGIKTSGSGKTKQYYQWDHTHNDIEVFNHKGLHRGSMDPITGEIYKGRVKGRSIDI